MLSAINPLAEFLLYLSTLCITFQSKLLCFCVIGNKIPSISPDMSQSSSVQEFKKTVYVVCLADYVESYIL